MIVKTTKEINGIEYDYTYSDTGMMIERNGARYSEAVDPLNSGREYTETDEPIGPVDDFITPEEFMAKVEEVL
jgi:hypothetical protein